MKRILGLALVITMIFSLSACKQSDDIVHMGLNAEILEISRELRGFVVEGLDDASILGERCYINCEGEDIYFIYLDNEKSEPEDLAYNDFEVGDIITVDVKSVENKYALGLRIQLLSQRK